MADKVCVCVRCRCDEDVNECERGERCEGGASCVNTFGSFYCNCTTPGFVGGACAIRPVLVPDMRSGPAYFGREELIGVAVVLFLIMALVFLFVAFRKKVFQKSYSRNDLSLVQDPATAALLHKANGHFPPLQCGTGDPISLYTEGGRSLLSGEPIGLYTEGGRSLSGPPQVPVRPMAYTPCFGTLEKRGGDRKGTELTEMSTFRQGAESPRVVGSMTRRGVAVCSVAPNRSECDSPSNKRSWEDDDDGERDRIDCVCVCILKTAWP